MEQYNPRAKCVKCGNDNADTRWLGVIGGKDTDQILRTCSCGYQWNELALDANEKNKSIILEEREIWKCRCGHQHLSLKDKEDCDNDRINVGKRPYKDNV